MKIADDTFLGNCECEWVKRVSPVIVACIYETYDYNFRIENDFTNYLKESCL